MTIEHQNHQAAMRPRSRMHALALNMRFETARQIIKTWSDTTPDQATLTTGRQNPAVEVKILHDKPEVKEKHEYAQI